MKAYKKQSYNFKTPITILVCILVFIFGYIKYSGEYVTTTDAYVEGKLASINTKVGGLVLHVYAEENQEVKKGDLLVELDPSLYYSHLRKAELDLKNAKIKLNISDLPEDNIRELQPKTKSIFSKFRFNNNQFSDFHTKYDEEISPQEDKDFDPNSLTAPETKLNKDIETKKQDSFKEKKEEKFIDLPQEIQKLAADIEQTKLDLSYTKIHANQDGIISVCSVKEGEYVYVGQNIISVIPKRVWVTAKFSQKAAEKIDVGQPVKVKIKQYPGRTFKGVVDNIQRDSKELYEENSDKVVVRIIFVEDYSDFNIQPGTSATVQINVK